MVSPLKALGGDSVRRENKENAPLPVSTLKIVDAEEYISCLPEGVRTVRDLVSFFSALVASFLGVEGQRNYVFCFEATEFIPSIFRRKQTKAPQIAELTMDFVLPRRKWKRYISDPRFRNTLVDFVSKQLIEDDHILLQEGCWLAIQKKGEGDFCSVFFRYIEEGSYSHKEEEKLRNKIGSSSMSCFFFCRGCTGMDIVIESNKTEIVPIAILLTRDRCGELSCSFTNNIHLRVRMKHSSPLLVDCNRFYDNLRENKGISSSYRVEVLCATLFAMQRFKYKLLLDAFFENKSKFSRMANCGFNDKERTALSGDPKARRYPVVDEPLFHQLFLGSSCEKLDRDRVEAHCRRLTWTLSYWMNGHRDTYDIVDKKVESYMEKDLNPTRRELGLSLYGFDENGAQENKVVCVDTLFFTCENWAEQWPFLIGYRRRNKRKRAL
jgi:hypothetical protein